MGNGFPGGGGVGTGAEVEAINAQSYIGEEASMSDDVNVIEREEGNR